jgi:hypothetical protein
MQTARRSMATSHRCFIFYCKDFYERLFYAGEVDIPTQALLRRSLAGVHGCAHSNRDDRLPAAKAGIAKDGIDSIVRPDAPCFGEKGRAIMSLPISFRSPTCTVDSLEATTTVCRNTIPMAIFTNLALSARSSPVWRRYFSFMI